MTTIALSTDIPSNINTLERLFFHVSLALNATIGAATFNLDGTADGGRTPHISINRGRATGDGKEYAQIIAYIPVDARIDNNALNQRPWQYAEEISSNAYPIGYRAT
ncbi:hypothetical protein PN467_08070 [Microcystis aeruginosa CS-563/04]|jgi:hypothetical protein|uniref:Uncharacterized protein n=1 Tax=Microcystis viridis Mv_BB_P_19951000_S68D TaxID=2486270 RepID=A0A552HRV1_MICVR|nr:hypothetical protein [Microcystis aeruginosa]MDB9420478.1 hypothetical protein [Microcystis aeruginosa CS-563/04]TRU73955.1 MAG: hypothetical protein EWV77_10880 [Microcystis viridis Mv_BB_P_19951000_S68D]TRU91054.1 MAG: hypothetical protein EWV46_00200 [Microcystis viridis Mv_BB_P_19951000_S69D]